MIDYKEIMESWLISINPTKPQQELAEKRLNICLGCDYKREILKGQKWSGYCGDCGCPLQKKIYSNIFNACTQKKWADVDIDYITPTTDKGNNTLI